jgi:hypothetical protein
MTLAERIRRYVAALPPAISGSHGHNATFHAACVLRWGFGLSTEEAAPFLMEYNERCLPPWSEHELRHKLSSVDGASHDKQFGYLRADSEERIPVSEGGTPPVKPRASPDPDLRARVIAQENVTLADLVAASPVAIDRDGPRCTEEVIDALFPEHSLICAGIAKNKMVTRRRETWRKRGLASLPLMVPSAMSKPKGINQEGKESERCLDNTGPRMFLVVEQDSGTKDEQTAVLWHLARFLPLTLVVHSGRRSLHGWFFVKQATDGHVDQFMDLAVRLGADNAMRIPCQPARIPDGTRETGERQCVLFFDPQALRLPAEAQGGRAADHQRGPCAQEPPLPQPEPPTSPQPLEGSTQPSPGDIDSPPGLIWPQDIEALLKDPPRYGKGLLPWIKTVALRMLKTGAPPQRVAYALHRAIKDQDFPADELLALKCL